MKKSNGSESRKNPLEIPASKYGNIRTGNFASKLEAALYDYLWTLEQAGELRNLRCQHHIYLTLARIVYIVDFSAVEVSTDKAVYFEAKGFETDVWRIKKRLWEFYGPGKLEVWRGRPGALFLAETVIPCQN